MTVQNAGTFLTRILDYKRTEVERQSAKLPLERLEAMIGVIAVFSTLTALCTLQGPDHFRWQYKYLEPARNELFTLANDDLLRRLYFDPQVVRQDAAILKRHHLSVFR